MSEASYVADLIDQEDDFDRWYVDVIQKAELADDAPVRGCKVIRPYGYGLWERMAARLDARIKATGVENAYFPLFIPKSLLEREAAHVDGFAPEVAWVTRGGNHELPEPWAVRPSSEAIVCPSFAKWVQSYRDLPILLNQLSHRAVGAVIMVHGDDAGLKLPPAVAPVQVIVVPIWRTAAELGPLEATVARITERLRPVARAKVDWRDDRSPGYKFNEWELKGVPIRLEVGPRDVAADQAVLVRRDTREKLAVPLANLTEAVVLTLESIQAGLFAAASQTLAERMVPVENRAELSGRTAANAGWSVAHWCGGARCEAAVKAETKATIRCIPRDVPDERGHCIVCDRPSERRVIFARAY